MILRGRAVGGPRADVILEAGPRWLGTLERHPGGHYSWDAVNSAWVWTVHARKTKKVGR